jgi:hypothetical protein
MLLLYRCLTENYVVLITYQCVSYPILVLMTVMSRLRHADAKNRVKTYQGPPAS